MRIQNKGHGFNVPRVIEDKTAQWYRGQPNIRCFYVGYGRDRGRVDRAKPRIFQVDQIGGVVERRGSKIISLDLPADSPLRGRQLGVRTPCRREYEAQWAAAFQDFCRRQGLFFVRRLTRGCVIEKTAGDRFQLRNFDVGAAWCKNGAFADIRRVYRSPLQAIDMDKVPPMGSLKQPQTAGGDAESSPQAAEVAYAVT